MQTTSYATWAGDVAGLCHAIAALEPLVGPLGAVDPRGADWHGQLFGKLAGQVAREPVLVAAVCGGTNTGKSLIANSLVGSSMSRSVPEAARTVHPVVSLPAGHAATIDLTELFPGFTPLAWTSDADALDAPESDRLLWREDPTGRQPARLILLDTPDIDGTLRENWHRAELVRNACDVLVAVLTQQKYNDAAVRDFFRAAAQARKSVIIVFNMVDWPRQRERLAGWLATFTAETGIAPLAVYACPHDFVKAEVGRIDFFAVPELTGGTASSGSEGPADLAAALAGADFDRLKREAMRGALEVVLD
ncbi:MAG: GTPase, partial [Planctomycetia bacterium]